jgi:hypothetical protein
MEEENAALDIHRDLFFHIFIGIMMEKFLKICMFKGDVLAAVNCCKLVNNQYRVFIFIYGKVTS